MNNTQVIAEQYKITEQVNALKKSLLEIPGVVDVEFDLNGFYHINA